MGFIEILLIGVSLAMDAFAVSMVKGLSFKRVSIFEAIKIGLYFGLFQGIMPVLGYLLGMGFSNFVSHIDHWIAFIALGIIGFNMIKESFEEVEGNSDTSFKTMIILSIATSIDALVVGVTFSFLKVNIIKSVTIIGLTTFIISLIGVLIGHIVGKKFGSRANLFGGIVLISIGVKILIEHLLL